MRRHLPLLLIELSFLAGALAGGAAQMAVEILALGRYFDPSLGPGASFGIGVSIASVLALLAAAGFAVVLVTLPPVVPRHRRRLAVIAGGLGLVSVPAVLALIGALPIELGRLPWLLLLAVTVPPAGAAAVLWPLLWTGALNPGDRPGRCPHCGYDLRATVAKRCPECGQARD